ncbi:hypothetical protein [Lentibacter sp. XHP0401]|jgi:hypothetical protein|uniref:hypothetical protein n=1 Tax=Lentibacter sp. XHP0401 TaxID=2984334 RepID=UPI0021E7F90D|nr:hypothetical protein [Lentibacter sp. XHP0401]MCV2894988.1 hypothetical protein [Lentibacter sp. XHP0401]
MPPTKTTNLKITVSASEKQKISSMGEHLGFPTMSGYVLACVRANLVNEQMTLSRKILELFWRLDRLEADPQPFGSLSKTDRQALAKSIREKLLDLCSDGGAA